MNETINTILTRRSIRAYKPEQIRDEELDAILKAGMYAPSAVNQQSWHFTVVQNKDMLKRIDSICKAVFKRQGDENFSVIYNAPTLIIVSGNENAVAPQLDGALAIENMFLAAESLGIGSCWINAVRSLPETSEGRALKKELGIPAGYIIVGSGAFGYKNIKQPSPAPRKEGLVNIIR